MHPFKHACGLCSFVISEYFKQSQSRHQHHHVCVGLVVGPRPVAASASACVRCAGRWPKACRGISIRRAERSEPRGQAAHAGGSEMWSLGLSARHICTAATRKLHGSYMLRVMSGGAVDHPPPPLPHHPPPPHPRLPAPPTFVWRVRKTCHIVAP